MREDHWRTEAEPFADLTDNHVPFRLTRAIARKRRQLWQWAVLGFVVYIYGCALWLVCQ